MPDRLFEDPQMAELYDAVDGPRDDLELYLSIRDELDARSILDVGCGTGSLACALARVGVEVVGIDPAAAMVAVARKKDHAEKVRFLVGPVTALPRLQVDLVTMTGNVAQVFLTEKEWAEVLEAVHAALRPGGHLVLETRVPAMQAWRSWTRQASHRAVDVAGRGRIEAWAELVEVRLPLVTFQSHLLNEHGAVLSSRSTLRFRSLEEVEASLSAAGFSLLEVRDAPDRPGREYVVVARRDTARTSPAGS